MLVLPGAVGLTLIRRFGLFAVLVVAPIAAAWVMLVSPLLIMAVGLISPRIARDGFRPRQHPLHGERREERPPAWLVAPGMPSLPAKLESRYGYRRLPLVLVGALAVIGTALFVLIALS